MTTNLKYISVQSGRIYILRRNDLEMILEIEQIASIYNRYGMYLIGKVITESFNTLNRGLLSHQNGMSHLVTMSHWDGVWGVTSG